MKECSLLTENIVVEELKSKKMIITTAESCTGGMIASRIVNVPGASAVFKQGYITYCDEAKISILGVKADTLEKYHAVSRETAAQMAEGGARAAGAEACIAVTGVAGPDKEDGMPVGLVYIGLFIYDKTYVKEFHFSGSRTEIRNQACEEALKLILEYI